MTLNEYCEQLLASTGWSGAGAIVLALLLIGVGVAAVYMARRGTSTRAGITAGAAFY